MTEGYSISEVAKLLGVPQRRVWQLVERGVLAGGLDDRRRWRVHLAEAVPESPPPASRAVEVPRESDAGTDTATATASATAESGQHFRDLLAELRNLQERYGQALLALGEARGEVAVLRTQVAQLTARVDLRLPISTPPVDPPSAGAGPAPEAAAPAIDEASPATAPVPARGPTARARGARRRRGANGAATATRFSGTALGRALARAEDPTPAELPGAREAAEALAALRAAPPSAAASAADPTPPPVPEPTAPPAAAEPPGAAPHAPSEARPGGPLGRLRRWLGG